MKPLKPTPLKNILWVLLPVTFVVGAAGAAGMLLGYIQVDFTSAPPAQAAPHEPVTVAERGGPPATPTRTPFRPAAYTSTPTATPTATPTPLPTATFTPEPTNTQPPPPPPPPAQPEIPEEASVSGVVGHVQSLGLSCESRSAVDWAQFFGWNIGELEFLGGLPRSDNPEVGFVGNPAGAWGQIPPNPYGVHAAPVAALLRAYGVPAEDRRGMSWDDLRKEIASGEPVVVWVYGGVWAGGRAVDYTASDGQTVRVAPFEHTVIVNGYTASTVAIVDNNLYYNVSLDRFLSSWSVLGNQAVIRP